MFHVGPTQVEVASIGYDLNDNGRVGIANLALFASYFGQEVAQATDPLVTAADYNEDGQIGIADLAFIAAYFGKVPGDTLLYPEIPAPVPPAETPVAMITNETATAVYETTILPLDQSNQNKSQSINSDASQFSVMPEESQAIACLY